MRDEDVTLFTYDYQTEVLVSRVSGCLLITGVCLSWRVSLRRTIRGRMRDENVTFFTCNYQKTIHSMISGPPW